MVNTHDNSLSRHLLACLAAAGTLTLAAGLAAAQCYQTEVIDAVDTTWDATSWFSVNDSGDMVGNFCAAKAPCQGWDSDVQGALYDAATGKIEHFDAPDGYNIVQMVGLNERGVVVGTAVAGDGYGGIAGAAAFRYERGVATVIDDPVGTGYWAATDINAAGTVVGYARTPDEPAGRVGWVLAPDGELTTLEVPGALRTLPFAVNSRGDVAGYFLHRYGFRGGFVLYADGELKVLTDVDEPPFHELMVYGINNAGTLVGAFDKWDANFDWLGAGAFVWPKGGEMQTLNVADYTDTQFNSVNNRGVIAGTAAGMTDGLLVTPDRCR